MLLAINTFFDSSPFLKPLFCGPFLNIFKFESLFNLKKSKKDDEFSKFNNVKKFKKKKIYSMYKIIFQHRIK